MRRFIFQLYAAMVVAALAQPCIAATGMAQEANKPTDKPKVALQPEPSPDVMAFYRDWTKDTEAEAHLAREATIERLRKAIKYVFVIFNENESFDHHFGTFPGANGIYSDGQHPRAPKDTPGFTQAYKNLARGTRTGGKASRTRSRPD